MKPADIYNSLPKGDIRQVGENDTRELIEQCLNSDAKMQQYWQMVEDGDFPTPEHALLYLKLVILCYPVEHWTPDDFKQFWAAVDAQQ